MEPIIGITCSQGAARDAQAGQAGCTHNYVKQEYFRSIERYGGVPILLPIVDQEQTFRLMAEIVDGLLLTGGEDVDPSYYGEENLCRESEIHLERDRVEFGLLHRADELNLPVLGICRGLQVMNVHYGGSLYQDLSLRPETGVHRSAEPNVYLPHMVRIAKGSSLALMDRADPCEVNSRHHQIVHRLASGFSEIAWAPDGVVEAIERPGGSRFLVGVQWHPELMPDHAVSALLFRTFMRAAAERTA